MIKCVLIVLSLCFLFQTNAHDIWAPTDRQFQLLELAELVERQGPFFTRLRILQQLMDDQDKENPLLFKLIDEANNSFNSLSENIHLVTEALSKDEDDDLTNSIEALKRIVDDRERWIKDQVWQAFGNGYYNDIIEMANVVMSNIRRDNDIDIET